MTSIVFAGFSVDDLPGVAPVFPRLRAAALEPVFCASALHPPRPDQTADIRTYGPPAIGAILAAHGVRLATYAALLESPAVVTALAAAITATFDACVDVEQPVLAVLPAWDTQSALVAARCEQLGIPYVSHTPQSYEFKYDSNFGAYRAASAYFVAGDFGRERLERRGVPRALIHCVGSARYDRLLPAPLIPIPALGDDAPAVLVTTQELPENARLFDRLCAYLVHRPTVHLTLRPHPGAHGGPREAVEPYAAIAARYGLQGRVAIAPAGSLQEQLQKASVLVTISSATILDAMLEEVPSIVWLPGPLPTAVPFGIAGDAAQARDADELQTHLDAFLFDDAARRRWAERHRGAATHYLGEPRFGMHDRMTDLLVRFASRRTQTEHESGSSRIDS